MAQAADDNAEEEQNEKFPILTSIADLDSYIEKVPEDQNVILSFYIPKEDVANPMTERLQDVMDNEGIYTVTVAQIDIKSANEDILKRYYKDDPDFECLIAIDKTKDKYPAVKTLTNFMQMSIKRLVVNHKYQG